MNPLTTLEIRPKVNSKDQHISFDWENSQSVQHLLDVISSILAKEYIQIAKENPETFKNQGGIK